MSAGTEQPLGQPTAQETGQPSGPLNGIRVVEVAAWAFVPSSAAVLSDWGADVIKIEPTGFGDPIRGLQAAGGAPKGAPQTNFMVEVANRGKRSVALDLATPGGREALLTLVATADVFMTSFLPATRKKLGIDVDDIRAVNPTIVYARGSGWGVRGDEATAGGFDSAAYTGRGGVANAVTLPGRHPAPQRPAFGDIMSGLTLAGGIAAALVGRARTGRGEVVDVSLLGTAVWHLAPDIAAGALYEGFERPSYAVGEYPNPVSGAYRTADERYLTLALIDSQRHWPDFCRRLGRADLIDDPRFADMAARKENRVACCEQLAAAFASRTLAEWSSALDGFEGVWAPNANPDEVRHDPQVVANGYVQQVELADGPFTNVTSPVQFGENPARLRPAPQHGADTDEVLLASGYDMDRLLAMKIAGEVL
ncbi:CoA transferase [Amycolatopsis rhabdoformis]|uniref:CoA transferase n=1 Tax=Amycolatopsis rhabdoformis TaxID=1448059 RepID=A0ABZ1IFX0_9PSEU|nr:CoA transferase [Amycolatopsis rhabdoformis]WSE32568.1 CoA transferase [Amycolatopsis rhabdoformis]